MARAGLPSETISVSQLTGTVAAIGDGASVIYHAAISAAEEARQQEKFEREKMAQAVARLAETLREQVDAAPLQRGSPYKYLLHYDLAAVKRFFGRATLVANLLDQLTCSDSRCRLVVLHGDAGMGKTSLLQAGLMPALVEAQHLPLLVRVTAAPLVTTIKQSLLPTLTATPNLEHAPLHEFMRQMVSLLPKGKQVFILLDQFEMFFEASPEARRQFVDELAGCLYASDARHRWLIGLRSAWLGHLNVTFQPTISQPLANTLVLSPLTRTGARSAIVEPAQLRRVTVEEQLLNVLLDDLGGNAIDPFRLQMVCHTLFEALGPDDNQLTLAAYAHAGRAEGILQNYLNTVLARHLPPADHEPAWHLLAAVADRHSGPATEADLVARLNMYHVSEAQTRRVLARLEDNRLVRLIHEHYELTSDTFRSRIQQWATERAVMEQARSEALRQFDRLRRSALRGFLGGAVGFALAYLLSYAALIPSQGELAYIVLPFTVAWHAMLGGLAGFVLILLVDIALASFHGPRRSRRWLMGGLSGAGSLGLAVLLHILPTSIILYAGDHAGVWLVNLALAMAEGVIWGLIAGLGTVWVLSSRRPLWQTVSVVGTACGLVLAAAENVGHVFRYPRPGGIFDPPFWIMLIVGAVMPLSVLAAALLAGRES